MATFTDLSSPELLALCLWGEARGEAVEGQIAVASVIRNRVDRRKSSYAVQILKPWQFSCFNEGDPNRAKLEALANDLAQAVAKDPLLRQCLWVARGCVDGMVWDNTKGADHYLTLALSRSAEAPSWMDLDKKTVMIGNHIFFNLEG